MTHSRADKYLCKFLAHSSSGAGDHDVLTVKILTELEVVRIDLFFWLALALECVVDLTFGTSQNGVDQSSKHPLIVL